MSFGAAALPPKLATPSTFIAQWQIPHCCNSYLWSPTIDMNLWQMEACQICHLKQTNNNNPDRNFSEFTAIQGRTLQCEVRGTTTVLENNTKDKQGWSSLTTTKSRITQKLTPKVWELACAGELHLQNAMSRFGISADHLSPAQGIHHIAPADWVSSWIWQIQPIYIQVSSHRS